jgi:hypothetical protein
MALLKFNFSQKSRKNGKRTTSQLILKLPEIKILSMIGRNGMPNGLFPWKNGRPEVSIF